MSQSIAAKIQKLIAKADSTTHPEEADSFMSAAHRLLERHGLNLLDVGKLDTEDPIGHDLEGYRSSDGWKNKIAGQLARYYGCELVFDAVNNSTKVYVIFGRESARVTLSLMMPFVFKQVAKMANQEYKEFRYRSAAVARMQIANALAVRLRRLRLDSAPKTDKENNGVNALVPLDLIEQEIGNTFSSVRRHRSKYNADINAHNTARRVKINQQVNGSSDSSRMLQ